MARIVIKIHYIVAIVLGVVIVGVLAGLMQTYLGARVNRGTAVTQGDTYKITYKTSSTVPAVNVELCHNDPQFCIPLAEKDSDGEVTIVVPANFPTGDATVNVLELDKKLAVTGKTQKSAALTITKLGGSMLTAADEGAGSFFDTGSSASSAGSQATGTSASGSSGSQVTTKPTISPKQTPVPTATPKPTLAAGTMCPFSSCPSFKPGGTCPNGQKVITVCVTDTLGQCNWNIDPCPNQTPTPTPASFFRFVSDTISGIPVFFEQPTATPFVNIVPRIEKLSYYYITHYDNTALGETGVNVWVDWTGPPEAILAFRQAGQTTWELQGLQTLHTQSNLFYPYNLPAGKSFELQIQPPQGDVIKGLPTRVYTFTTRSQPSGFNPEYIAGPPAESQN